MAKKVSISSSKKNDYTFKKVAENLYRLNQTGGYYALVKRGGKQIRRSLKTKDRALAKRRLNDFKKQINRLTSTSDIPKSTFSEFAERWLKAAEAFFVAYDDWAEKIMPIMFNSRSLIPRLVTLQELVT